jgi:hypothetical protein
VEDGRSIEAAMADARRDEERTLASAQLEAFHQTFNFCMDCRQYTCTDCWNQAEGRCQTCAPMPGRVEADAATPLLVATNGADAGTAWPTIDLAADETPPASAAVDVPATPYMPTDLRPVELPDDEVETMVGAADVVEAAAVVEAPAERAPVAAAEEEAEVVIVAETVESVAIEAEAETAAVEAVEAEAVAVVEAEPIQVEVEAVEVEAVEVEAHPEPEPVPAEAPAPQQVTPEPAPPVPSPAWTIVAPDVPSETPSAPPAWPPRAPVYQPPATAPAAEAPAASQPGQPSWPTLPPAAFTVPAAQVVWEESSLGVINRPGSGVQACVSCGLPLSASARFCRRCGSRQG